jgi:predicted transcriptional regulator
LLQRVERGIESSGLTNYFMYIIAKRLMFAGPLTAAALSEQLRQSPAIIGDNLRLMTEQGLVTQEKDTWTITDAGRNAMIAANDSGEQVLEEIRNAIGASTCDQLVAGMREALAALRRAA